VGRCVKSIENGLNPHPSVELLFLLSSHSHDQVAAAANLEEPVDVQNYYLHLQQLCGRGSQPALGRNISGTGRGSVLRSSVVALLLVLVTSNPVLPRAA
jgi:hypothetical protein